MNIEENRNKIMKLASGIKWLKKIKKSVFKNDYLKKECELNLRVILHKYCMNMELTEDESDLIEKYMFFSDEELLSTFSDGPDDVTLGLVSHFGYGDFNEEELNLINEIHSKISESRKTIK